MKKKKIEFEKSIGNIYADLGLKESASFMRERLTEYYGKYNMYIQLAKR